MPSELDPAFTSYETPTEGMKRIERAMQPVQDGRMIAPAGVSSRGNYSAGVGVQGPLSGALMASSKPYTGEPSALIARGEAGPVSYQAVQPMVRGAPMSQTLGVGGKPFDADAYFGVNATRAPGQGTQYGAEIRSGGFGAQGQYDPATKGYSVGAGYQTNFATGGRAVVGHTTAAGEPVSLEEHKGQIRHRQDSGASRMAADYGYIDTSKPDHDGMKTDAFVGPHRDSKKVFVVNQQHPHTGKFNEHKVLLGYKDRAHALRDYAHSFSDGLGHKRIQSVVEMGTHELKDWLKKDHTAPLKKAVGGPVHMADGGDPPPRPLTIYRGERPTVEAEPETDLYPSQEERPIPMPMRRPDQRPVITPAMLAAQMVPPEEQSPIEGRQAASPSPEGVTAGLQTVGEGAVPLAEMTGEYLKSRFYDPGQQFEPNTDTGSRSIRHAIAALRGPEATTEGMDPSAFLQDVGKVATSVAHGAAEDPAGFIGGLNPIVGAAQAAASINEISDAAAEAEASGHTELAKKLKGAASGIGLLAAMPGGHLIAKEAAATAKAAAKAAKKSSIGDVVAKLSKMAPEEVAAIREAHAGRGLEFPEEEGLDRLRMNLQREQKASATGAEMPGMPSNERTVVRGPRDEDGNPIPGKPDFVLGKVTPEDWVDRAEALMSPKEIEEAANWYPTIRGEFLKYTNGDEAKADKYMRAWLVTQQNVDVSGAMNNVLLQREQFGRGVPIEQMKAAGMPNPTGAARSVLQDAPIEQGVGQKIADFVDAAEGKDVRSWMANHPEGGSPFVVDVHTARDTGLVDEKLLNHLRRRGYNEEDLQNVAVDMQGTPSGTQYENRAHWGRNDLTNHLNNIKWQGRSDWTPSEVQAVGWMGMTRLTADKAEDVVSGIERNVRRVSFEIAPGEGSPWEKMFGSEFSALPLQEQQRITQVVAGPAMDAASKISGIDLTNLVHGTGGWNMYQNPAAVGQALATKQGSEIAANVLGYLLQQTEVWSNSVKPMTKNPKAFAVDFMQESKSGNNYLASNDGIKDFWEQVQKMDPTAGSKKPLFVGYQPITSPDGRPGIRVLIDRGGVKTQNDLEAAIRGPMSKMLEDFPTDISIRGHEAELTKARNDWKGQSNGQSYLARLEQLLGRNPTADLDPIRGQLEEIFKRELQSASGPKTRKAQGGPVKGFAQGGPVTPASATQQVANVAHDLASIAHKDRLDQRHLAYLLKVASGMYMPPERAMQFAGQILTGDVPGLIQRFRTYVPSIRTFARLNEMMGGKHDFMGSGHMGKEMQRMKGVDGLNRMKEHVEGVMDSDVVKSRPSMAKALKKISKRI